MPEPAPDNAATRRQIVAARLIAIREDGPDELDSAGQPRNIITDRYAPPGSAERLGHPLTLVALDEVERRRRRQHRRRLLECAVALAVMVLVGLALAHRAGAARVDWQRSTASVYNINTGQRPACGWRYTKLRRVVAHRSLACGTRVRFLYRGRKVDAVVGDRGPYVYSREWDLTTTLAEDLGTCVCLPTVSWRIP